MSITATIRQSSAMGGVSFPESKSITADAQIVHDVSVPAANAGTLTTRTDDTDGEITMTSSTQTIETGDRIDLYWVDSDGVLLGARRGATAGTVAGAVVPFSGGSGDNLPIEDEDIIACECLELDVFVDGDNVDVCLAYISKLGQVTFIDTDASEAEIDSWMVGEACVKMWHDEDADDNPFLAQNIGRIYVSHLDTSAATARIGIAYNNVAG